MSKDSDKQKMVPKQEQLTPEQEAEFREYSLKKQQQFRRNFLMRRYLVALLVIAIPAGIIAFFYWGDREVKQVAPVQPKQNNISSVDNFQEIEDPKLLMAMSQKLGKFVQSEELPTKIRALKERVRIAERMIELDGDTEVKEFGKLSKTNALMAISFLEVQHKMQSTGPSKQLNEWASNLVDSESGPILSRAKLALVVAKIRKWIESQDEKGKSEVKTALDNLATDFSNQPVKDLQRLIPLLGESPTDRKEMITYFADKLIGSEVALYEIGTSVKWELDQGPANIGLLRQLALSGSKEATEEIEGICRAVEANPDAGYRQYASLLYVLESIAVIDNKKEWCDELIESLREAHLKITNEDSKAKTLNLLNDYNDRQELVGSVLPDGVIPDAYLEKTDAVVLFFFAAENVEANSWLAQLNEVATGFRKKVTFLLLAADSGELDNGSQITLEGFSNGEVCPPDVYDQISPQIRPPWLPYAAIVNSKTKEVFAINVPTEYLRQKLNLMLKR